LIQTRFHYSASNKNQVKTKQNKKQKTKNKKTKLKSRIFKPSVIPVGVQMWTKQANRTGNFTDLIGDK
jgi:hypothetical protein